MFPLFGGIPGGVELIILFIIFLFFLAVPVAIGVGLYLLGRRSGGHSEEVELLRDRVNTLEKKVEAREASLGADEAEDDADRER